MRRLLLLSLLSLWTPATQAMSVLHLLGVPPADQMTRPPPPETGQGMADRIVVRKAARRLYLMRGDQIVRRYDIALGFQPEGHKRHAGDGRTPEGRYILDRRHAGSRFHRSLHLSYPDPQDRRRAGVRGRDPGGMIMIHGQPPRQNRSSALAGDWTSGCIAVSNPAIDEIWSMTRDGTPIEILP